MSIVKGYKAMNSKMECRGFKFKIGKTYETDALEMCNKGFHFCENILDVYNYYEKTVDTIICEVEALGKVLKENDKSATDKIKIVKQLSHEEILSFVLKNNNSGDGNSGNRNSGDWNSGNRNSGDGNSGDWNSGYGNSGNRNSGDWNSGDGNSGYGNSGNRNSGDGNSGDWNSGYGNSGNRNSGDWNSGDGNSGYFNTKVPVYFFNKPSNIEYTKELENKLRSINVKPILQWISTESMSEIEQKDNPSHKVTGGFLRKTNRHDWTKLTDADKKLIKSLPNFDDEVFKQISGVSLLKAKTIKVTIEGVEHEIDLDKAKELGLIK